MPNPRLKIEKSVFGGEGLAHHEGKACFVEGALPGETVNAKILHEAKNWSRARTVKILEPSTHRIQPVCEYYGRCGGCQYQHVQYEEELRMKQAQLEEIFEKVPGAASRLKKIVRAPQDLGYRLSATFHTLRYRMGAQLAYISRDNTTPMAVQHCAILDPALARVFHSAPRPKTKKVSYKLSGDGRIVSDEREDFFRVQIDGRELIANSKAFFQNNREVTALLAQKVRLWIEAIKPETLFDLYAGIGTFTFLSAESVPRILCVEENAFALSALRMKAVESGRTALEMVQGRVERTFPGLWEKAGSPEAVLLMDPPRQGLDKRLAGFLSKETQAKALIYISCDPATLARDLRILLSGRWRIEELAPFDMFPRTKHVETAALLYYNEGA